MNLLCFVFLELSWNSDDENYDIFEPGRSFSGVFYTFLNQWCVKNDENVFKLAFRLLIFPKFLKCWKLTHIKNLIFNTIAKLIIAFCSNREINTVKRSI